MSTFGLTGARRRVAAMARGAAALTVACATTTVVIGVAAMPGASAAVLPVQLGAADDFAVLAATTVTNGGLTMVSGDLGVSPGTAVTGFPPGVIADGTIHTSGGIVVQAQSDLHDAYNEVAGRPTTATVSDVLGGTTKFPGVYVEELNGARARVTRLSGVGAELGDLRRAESRPLIEGSRKRLKCDARHRQDHERQGHLHRDQLTASPQSPAPHPGRIAGAKRRRQIDRGGDNAGPRPKVTALAMARARLKASARKSSRITGAATMSVGY